MKLLLTFDYELFGDGTGCVFTHMIEPTNTILAACDTYGIKITIFFEVLEYIRLKEEWNKGNHMGYKKNPIEAIEKQLQKAAIDGHDIQLHIHPQWHNASYIDDRWILDFSQWRLGCFSDKAEHSIKDLIQECKLELENIISSVKPNYKCIALRAGSYNIMPSVNVYKAMFELGIQLDSSVFPGGFEEGTLSNYDYRKVSNELGYWWADKMDIRQQSIKTKEVIELPIFALPVTRWKRFCTISKIKALIQQRNTAMSSLSREKIKNKNFFNKINLLFEKEATPWDVCMFSKKLHKRYFKHIHQNLSGKRDTFVLIGHPKNLNDEKLFNNFLKLTRSIRQRPSFTTITEYYESII